MSEFRKKYMTKMAKMGTEPDILLFYSSRFPKIGLRPHFLLYEGAVWGNIIAGGVIGYAVDAGSGAGFSYPQTMNVEVTQGEIKENTAAVEVVKESPADRI